MGVGEWRTGRLGDGFHEFSLRTLSIKTSGLLVFKENVVCTAQACRPRSRDLGSSLATRSPRWTRERLCAQLGVAGRAGHATRAIVRMK